ncbi:MAG: NUDIX domain-containing protein [Pseudonocardiaceae bacterium]
MDHVKAGLWLFPGGHVDDGEDPRLTVLREAAEELRIDGVFHPWFGDDPLFLTVTKTRGEHSHDAGFAAPQRIAEGGAQMPGHHPIGRQ